MYTRRLRRGRTVVAAALTLCAGFALSACRSQPGVAAYVGNETLTESQIDAVIDEATKAHQGNEYVPTRSDVVVTFVLNKGCAAKRAQDGFPLAPVTVADVAQAEAIPAATQYARDRTELHACVGGIQPDRTLPTDEELKEIFDRAVDQLLIDPSTPFAEVKENIAADSRVLQGLAARHLLGSLVDGGEVSVSPRYRPLEMGFSPVQNASGQTVPLVILTIGEPASDVVRDLG